MAVKALDMWSLSIECLSVLMIWWLASPRVSDLREEHRSHTVFYDLAQKSHTILLRISH